MNQGWRTALIVGGATVVLIGLCAALPLAGVISWQLHRMVSIASDLSDTLDGLVDEQVDAGGDDPFVDPDDPLLQERRILLAYDINSRTAKDVVARLFLLDAADHETPIDLYISTQGGWEDNAFAIIDAMQLIQAPVNTWAIGGCYSAGTMILTAGTGRRIATENAILMVHANLEDSTAEFSLDRLDRARYEGLFQETADLPAGWYPMTSGRSYYLSPEEALEFHVVDEIVGARAEAGEAPR